MRYTASASCKKESLRFQLQKPCASLILESTLPTSSMCVYISRVFMHNIKIHLFTYILVYTRSFFLGVNIYIYIYSFFICLHFIFRCSQKQHQPSSHHPCTLNPIEPVLRKGLAMICERSTPLGPTWRMLVVCRACKGVPCPNQGLGFPCAYLVHTWALKLLYRNRFKAQVCTI